MVLFTLSSAQNCTQPLGMQSGTISDCQISASSERKFHFGPANARLRFSGTDVRVGAWVAGTQDRNQWLQVDFGNETTVTGIDTHGRASERCPKCNDWVEKYNVAYSQDNVTFHQYKEDGQVKVFQTELDWLCRTRSRVICLFLLPFLKEFLANSDRDSIVRHVLSSPVVARYFRINPTQWKDRIAMRVELLGCRAGMDHPHLPTVLEPRLALTSYQSPVSLLRHQHFTKGFSTLSSLNWSYRMTISSFLSASRPSASPNSAHSSAGAPVSSQPASTSATLPPRMTSPAAVAATSSGRNPAAPDTITETSSQQQKQASFIDRTSSDVEMQSTESGSRDGESSEAPGTKTTSCHSSFGSKPAVVTKVSSLTPTATSSAASPLENYQQDLISVSRSPPVASSKNQHKSPERKSAKSSEGKTALSAVRTQFLVPAATSSGFPASTRLLPSATPSEARVPPNAVPTSSVVEDKVSHSGFHSLLAIVARVACGGLTTQLFLFQTQSSPLAKIRRVLESADPRNKSSLPVS